MTRLAELRSQRNDIAKAANALNDKYPNNKVMPKSDVDLLASLLDRVEAIDEQIADEFTTAQNRHPSQASANAAARRADEWRINGVAVNALRTVDDIRAHYASARTERDDEGASVADFLRGVAGLNISSAPKSIRAALAEGTDAAGGYLVPSIVMPQILEAMAPASSCMQAGAGMLPLVDGAKSFTLAGVDNIPTAAWRLENGAITESEPTFRAVIAIPKSLAFVFKVSRELLQDAAGLQQAAITAISQAFAAELDRAALRGTGVAPQPTGVLNQTAVGVNAVSNGANGASLATTKYANLLTGVQAILEDNCPMPSATIMSPRSRVVLGSQVDTTGQPLQVPSLLKDVRMLTTTQIPNNLTVGTSTDCSEIYLGDFTKMYFAMREQVSIARLEQTFAMNGQVGFIGHARADILLSYPKCFAVATGVRP